MKLYELAVNNTVVCEVTMDVPVWLPVKPRISHPWLKRLASQALHEFFSRPQYLPCDARTGSPILN